MLTGEKQEWSIENTVQNKSSKLTMLAISVLHNYLYIIYIIPGQLVQTLFKCITAQGLYSEPAFPCILINPPKDKIACLQYSKKQQKPVVKFEWLGALTKPTST